MICGRPASPITFRAAEELIEEARNGRMFILVDDEDRENEGDLVIPAQFATPDAINFMARHARGLICLALTRHRVEQLGLPLMSAAERHAAPDRLHRLHRGARGRHDRHLGRRSRAHRRRGDQPGVRARRHRDARPCVPADRARRAARWSAPATPRPRSTSRGWPGLNPAGVICEIMNDDGTMARLPDLVAFAQRHNLKLGYDRRSHRLSAPHRTAGAARGGGHDPPRRGRRLASDRLCEHGRVRRAPRAGEGRSLRARSRCSSGCTPSICWTI